MLFCGLQAIAAKVMKIYDVIKPYDGKGDIVAWMRRLKQMARLYKVEKDMLVLIPSFLEERAYAVYEQLPESVKEKVEDLEQSLYEAFSVRRYGAFEKLRRRELRGDESVDVFLADIRRLAALAFRKHDTKFFFLRFTISCATVN